MNLATQSQMYKLTKKKNKLAKSTTIEEIHIQRKIKGGNHTKITTIISYIQAMTKRKKPKIKFPITQDNLATSPKSSPTLHP